MMRSILVLLAARAALSEMLSFKPQNITMFSVITTPPETVPECGFPELVATNNETHVVLRILYSDHSDGNLSVTYAELMSNGLATGNIMYPGTCSFKGADRWFSTSTTWQIMNNMLNTVDCECPLFAIAEDNVTVYFIEDCPDSSAHPDAYYSSINATIRDWAVRQSTCDTDSPDCDPTCSLLVEAVHVRTIDQFLVDNPGDVEQLMLVSRTPEVVHNTTVFVSWGRL